MDIASTQSNDGGVILDSKQNIDDKFIPSAKDLFMGRLSKTRRINSDEDEDEPLPENAFIPIIGPIKEDVNRDSSIENQIFNKFEKNDIYFRTFLNSDQLKDNLTDIRDVQKHCMDDQKIYTDAVETMFNNTFDDLRIDPEEIHEYNIEYENEMDLNYKTENPSFPDHQALHENPNTFLPLNLSEDLVSGQELDIDSEVLSLSLWDLLKSTETRTGKSVEIESEYQTQTTEAATTIRDGFVVNNSGKTIKISNYLPESDKILVAFADLDHDFKEEEIIVHLKISKKQDAHEMTPQSFEDVLKLPKTTKNSLKRPMWFGSNGYWNSFHYGG